MLDSFSKRLKYCRALIGFNARQFVKELNSFYGQTLNYATYQLWESNFTRMPYREPIKAVVAFMNLLGLEEVTDNWLLDGTGVPPMPFNMEASKDPIGNVLIRDNLGNFVNDFTEENRTYSALKTMSYVFFKKLKTVIKNTSYLGLEMYRNNQRLFTVDNNYNNWGRVFYALKKDQQCQVSDINNLFNYEYNGLVLWNSIEHDSNSDQVNKLRVSFNITNGVTSIIRNGQADNTIYLIKICSIYAIHEDLFYSKIKSKNHEIERLFTDTFDESLLQCVSS